MNNYKYLFRPLPVGQTVLKNRIICGPHVTNFWPNNLPDERTTAYYEERAAGGVGLIIIGASPVDETAPQAPMVQCGLWTDDCIPGLRDIAAAVHRHDSKLTIQLAHPGVHQAPGDYEKWPVVAPSQIPAIEVPFRIPRELDANDISEIVDKYADAAERMQRAGLDGVEIHAGHGYLLWSFITPIKNKRTDEYGGSLENRMRFLLAVVEKVRTRVGKDFIVGCRLSSSDMVPGGMEPEDVAQLASVLEATGQIDYIHCSIGMYRSVQYTIPSHYSGLEPGYQSDPTGQVKAALTSIPMFLVGRVNDPMLADQLIAEGSTDACVMVRELLAEPNFANLAKQGKIDDIRPCAYWNQGCISRIVTGARAGCQINGATGYELEFGKDQLIPSSTLKQILVIGGGPAGMEFARIAATRGHGVTLHERSNELVGQVGQFARLPGRSEVRNWIDWLVRQIDGQAGIDVHLESEISSANIDQILAAAHIDEIVVATGARAAADGRSSITTEPIPGHELPHVLTYEDVLSGSLPNNFGSRVLIIDELADRIAPGIAEMLAESGHNVEIVSRWPTISLDFLSGVMELPFVYERLDELDIKRTTDTWIASIGEGTASAFNIYSGRDWEILADTVILVTSKYSNTEVAQLIRQRSSLPVHVIGDALAPRQVGDAVKEATRLAYQL